MSPYGECKVPDCDVNLIESRGMCSKHYRATMRELHQTYPTWRSRYVDPSSVRRFMEGDPPPRYGLWERREAVRALTSQGYSAAQIAEIVRVTPRQVQRDRARTA